MTLPLVFTVMELLYFPTPALLTAATSMLYVVEFDNPVRVNAVVAPPETLAVCVLLLCTQ